MEGVEQHEYKIPRDPICFSYEQLSLMSLIDSWDEKKQALIEEQVDTE